MTLFFNTWRYLDSCPTYCIQLSASLGEYSSTVSLSMATSDLYWSIVGFSSWAAPGRQLLPRWRGTHYQTYVAPKDGSHHPTPPESLEPATYAEVSSFNMRHFAFDKPWQTLRANLGKLCIKWIWRSNLAKKPDISFPFSDWVHRGPLQRNLFRIPSTLLQKKAQKMHTQNAPAPWGPRMSKTRRRC